MVRSLIAVVAAAVCVPGALAQPCGGEFGGLAGSLALNGNASYSSETGQLILTTANSGQASSAYVSNFRPRVADGFLTTFTFVIEQGSADGFAFIVQDSGLTALGGGGSSMGYDGISHALVVEFDTFSFGPPGEFPSTHIAIHTRCTDSVTAGDEDAIAHVVLDPETMNIADGQPHTCEIEFSQETLYVRLDGVEVLSGVPFSFINCDGDGGTIVTGGADGCAYVGFTGATGAATAFQAITAWSFDDNPPCVPADLASFINSQTVVEGETVSFSFEGVGSPPLQYIWRLNGEDLVDGGPISGATTNTITISPVGPEHAGQWDYVVTNECQGVGSGFTLTVEVLCVADFNSDGNLDPDDLADAIGCFFDPGCPFDFNGDANEDPDDLADYIAAYFGGCP